MPNSWLAAVGQKPGILSANLLIKGATSGRELEDNETLNATLASTQTLAKRSGKVPKVRKEINKQKSLLGLSNFW